MRISFSNKTFRLDRVGELGNKQDPGIRLGWGSLTAILVGLGHLGELFHLLGTVLRVALTFPLLTGLKPFLDNVDDFLINFAESKRNKMVCKESFPCTQGE